MNRIVKFFRLPHHDKVVFFQAVQLLFIWRLRLYFQNFKAAIHHNGVECTRLFATRTTHIPAQRISALLNAAGKIIPFTTCLSKALAGQILFNSYGHTTRLHIGVEKNNEGSLKAHAWLTLDGELLIGYVDNIKDYQELPPLPHI